MEFNAHVFKKWLGRTGRTQADIAKALGVSQGVVSMWAAGKRVPSRANAMALRELGVPTA